MTQSQATIPADLAPGAILRNGATVIESQWIPTSGQENRFVVLASTDAGGCREYVTWEAASGSNTYWGHYLSTLPDAVADFQARVAAHLD